MIRTAAQIRQQIATRLKSQSPEEIKSQSQAACSRLIQILQEWPTEILEGAKVALFRPLPEEVGLIPDLELFLRQSGARIFFPRMVSATELEFFEADSKRKDHWAQGAYGIIEPTSSRPGVQIQQLSLFFVPGMAFSKSFGRIGRGKGFYDRVLVRVPNALKIAITQSFQVLDQVPQESWDQKVDWIITPDREMKAPRVDQWLQTFRPT